jgi:hypothetical protein
MKTLRLFTIVLLAVLVVSMWGPAPVYASPSDTTSTDTTSLVIDPGKTKLAKLRVTNRTGGALYISMSGDRGYSFSTSKQGQTTFDAVIQPGKYTITVRTSGCSGELHYKRNVKSGTVSLPPFVCKTKNKKKK